MTKPKRPQQQYLSRVLHYKLHRRSLLAVFVLLMVLFASIGFLLYSEFSNYANSQTAAYATDLMAQQVNSTQNLWEEMDALSSSIQADQNISAFFTARKSDPLTNYHAFRSLGRYKALHPFIQNISLYNVTTGKQLNLLYYAREETVWNDEEIARGSTFSVPRMVTSPVLGETAVLTLVYPIRSYSNSYTCCIAIDIQRSHLQTMLTRSAGSHTYILGESNQLLVRPVDGYLPAEWGQVLSGLYQAGPEQGSFYQQLDGQKNLVSYCKFPTQAWTVVSIQPARGLLSAARSKIIMLVLFLLALLILSMGTMFILLLRIYRPIDDLVSQLPHESDAVVDEMAVISNELTVYRDRSDMMKQSLYQSNLQSLLFGLPCDRVELPASITQSERFVVGVLSHTKKREYTVEELNRLAVGQLPGLRECISFRWTDYRVLLFCFASADALQEEQLTEQMEKFCLACRKKQGSEVRLGVSPVVETPEQLHLAYSEALRLVYDSFYHQERILFTQDTVEKWRSAPATPTDTWLKRISGFLFHEQTDELYQALDAFFEECGHLSPNICIHVVSDVLRQCVELVESTCQPKSGEELAEMLARVEQSNSFDQLCSLSRELFGVCHRLLNESEQQRSLLRGQRIIHQVCEMIEKEYRHPGFSLQDAADGVSLSAGYLGRLFKQTAGQSFVEALTACRLKAAARMLVETDTPVAVISLEVGMENASYFSTVFRKAYGMSPSLYRETNQSATQKQQEGETKE